MELRARVDGPCDDHHAVQHAKMGHGLCHSGIQRTTHRRITGQREYITPGSHQFAANAIQFRFTARHQCEPRALRDQQTRSGRPDAGGRAHDHYDTATKLQIHVKS